MRPRALVFDLYGEYFRYTGGAARLGALTELMGVFDVEPTTVRVVMTRLRKDGWFDSSKSGREVSYLLNDKSWQLLDDGRSRIFERHFDEWDRTWTQALVDESGVDRDQRKRIEKALTWWGFGNYGGPAWFSPHDREKQLREALTGGDELHIQFLRGRSAGLAGDRLIAQRCWDLGELGADYQAFIEEFRPRLARYRRGLEGAAALIEHMRLMQHYRRYPFRDPDLPETLLPAGWRGRAAHEVFTECHDILRAAAEPFVAAAGDAAT
ncbi:BlaI/MecI/CopY family transcriptional regulator [Nocardia vinacea]|uniref:BlaI/MecI/CopY family transcriptional regulator n=1 Tax=Nocardia vinacea TaxID=96468 RepID=A0ABZ1Z0Q5_9NOCA|nr:BlaI/MecI/CopY family transcriptional regulator [Nocardia vinacea]